MNPQPTRRNFLEKATAGAALATATALLPSKTLFASEKKEPLFQISLAEYSLHRMNRAGKMPALELATFTKEKFGIDAVERWNGTFGNKAKDTKFLADMKKRQEDAGVKSLLIMIDREGNLGEPDDAKRKKSVENHYKWVEAAKFLGCHSIRVNARSNKRLKPEEQAKLVTDGLSRLCEFAEPHGINIIVENHGGLSSNGKWIAGVMKNVNKKNCGTLPDFGNFFDYDRYLGVSEMMPYAKAVSAKSRKFKDNGEEAGIDYRKMMKIVLDAGYRGYVGIEWEGSSPDEIQGVKLTQQLLERVREEMS